MRPSSTAIGLTPVDVGNAISSAERAGRRRPARRDAGAAGAAAARRPSRRPRCCARPKQFGNILLKVNPNGSQVRLRDVARIERGAETYFIDSHYNGQAASGIGVQLEPGANALATAQRSAREDRTS